MHKIYRIMVILLILGLLSGCEEKTVNNDIKPETKEELTIDEIYKKLDRKKLNKDEMWSLICMTEEKERDRLSEEFSWIKKCEWEAVDIINEDGLTKTITDTFIIHQFFRWFEFDKEVYGHFLYADVPLYTYVFKTSDKELSMEMVSENIVKIGDRHFRVSPYLHQLGDAFMPIDNWRVAGNIETKIANCGFIKDLNKKHPESPWIIWNNWRTYMIATNLSFAKKLDNCPNVNAENIKDEFLIFYFGEEMMMNIYDHHVQIVDGKGKEFWYEFMEEEAFRYISVPLLGAN